MTLILYSLSFFNFFFQFIPYKNSQINSLSLGIDISQDLNNNFFNGNINIFGILKCLDASFVPPSKFHLSIIKFFSISVS